MPSLWTPTLEQEFHQAVEALHAVTHNPSEEVSYATSLPEADSETYSLRFKDELQLANHLAFLAHSQEGVEAVSGVCVEEHSDGLIIRLASNRTPSADTVSGLRKILSTVSRGCTQHATRETLRDSIFEDVLNLSQERILQRIRPRWVPAPYYYVNGEEPLWIRIEQILANLRSRSGPKTSLILQLDKLLLSFRLLETLERPDERSVRAAVKAIVRHCAGISYGGEHRSLQQQLSDIPYGQRISRSREVAQIDKLARYLGASIDLVKLAQRQYDNQRIQDIGLECLEAYRAFNRVGALRKCHVHAEVQLILHYEENSLEKPPRAIGCSKSACFLCDLLIQTLGQYHISYAHRRLYNQWTIPDVSWMSSSKVQKFRSALKTMASEMKILTENARMTTTDRGGVLSRSYRSESKAILPLSSHSNFSISTVQSGVGGVRPSSRDPSSLLLPSGENDAYVSSEHSAKHSRTSVDLRHSDLPHQQPLNPNMGTLYLQFDGLNLIFECESASADRLYIREIKEAGRGKEHEVPCIRAFDIPIVGREFRRAKGSLALRVWLQILSGRTIEIEITYKAD